MSILGHRFFVKGTDQPVAGAALMRGDDLTLGIVIIDPAHQPELNQPEKVISLRLVVKLAHEHPHGAPLLVKQGADFVITRQGSCILSDVSLAGLETSIFDVSTTLIYDLERTLDGKRTTVEQARLTIIPDVAI